jgi:NitT/TauT family transport system ATP-binding protein
VNAPDATGGPGLAPGPVRDLLFSCADVSVVLPHAAGDRKVLDGITFDVHRGEVFTIVGPSGTGKTTLIRVLGGLTSATTGSVYINGRALTGPPEEVVIVFQDYSHALLQWRTVARNVAFGLEGRVSSAEIDDRVRDALRLVKLEKNADDYPWQLSGGMQQRVAIARALSFSPALLLMDEPFGALDEMTRERLNSELLRIWDASGSTVVFVTHSIAEAVFLSTRVVVMSRRPGRIAAIVDIDLPQPRTADTREEPRFFELVTAVRDRLREGGLDEVSTAPGEGELLVGEETA